MSKLIPRLELTEESPWIDGITFRVTFASVERVFNRGIFGQVFPSTQNGRVVGSVFLTRMSLRKRGVKDVCIP